MQSTFAKWFGGVIAFLLLLLYGGTLGGMIYHAWQNKQHLPPGDSGSVFIVTTIGSLVSALVVMKLAITPPDKLPSLTEDAATSTTESVLAIVYLLVWAGVGLAALIVGVLLRPAANQTVHDMGTSWLGIAVASTYAYFGIKPKNPPSRENPS